MTINLGNLWNEVTIWWNELTERWNYLTWNEVAMERRVEEILVGCSRVIQDEETRVSKFYWLSENVSRGGIFLICTTAVCLQF